MGDDVTALPAEKQARALIDKQLTQAGWKVQDKKDLNLFAGQGVAVREVVMKPGHGRVDYLLYVDRAVVGVIEAKPVGTPLSGVEWQSAMYANGLPPDVRLAATTTEGRLPFVFEASGTETHFTNGYDPHPRARLIFNVPRPETLARILRDADADPHLPTWRAKVANLPDLNTAALRPAQIKAIHGVENSLAKKQFDRSLVQMATGAGKTYTAVTEAYRLLKFGGFNRILFLVDRNNLADQTLGEFQNYREQGSRIEAGTVVPKVDRRTREQRLETLDDDLDYTPTQLDRAVTSSSQIRLVLETFRDRLFTEIFPGRSAVPKTLIFAKDDNHAEEIVRVVREVFGKGNDFAAKITYNARNAKEQLQALRTSPALRNAVTVDMIATGTDVKPLECVFFMRDVRSAQYFEQMKGRGARTITPADFQAVTPDADTKTRFVIVDAVGVTEHDFVDPPLNRDKSVSLKKLLERAAALTITEDEAATLASRLAKLELQLSDDERAEIDAVAGQPVRDIIRALVDAVEPATTTPEAIQAAITPIAANPELRNRILELRATHDRVIDEVSRDILIDASGVVNTERARSIVESWRAYLDENRDEITALQLGYEASERRVDFAFVQNLATRISRPPHNWTPEVIWNAYAALDPAKVHTCTRHTLTDLVSLIRFTVGVDDELVPYAERVQERYAAWLAQQAQAGVVFSDAERWWLDRMVAVIASSAGIRVEDLDEAPFTERGGTDGAIRDLGDRAGELVEVLNAELTA